MTAALAWQAAAWPRPGNCGACGHPARQAPSGRWWHDGRPCRARSQAMWSVDDLGVKGALQFVPAGEPLPAGPAGWHLDRDTATSYGVCRADHTPTVREFLAREAEEA